MIGPAQGKRWGDYNPEIAHKICDAIASSSKGLKALCKENKDFPSFETICSWRKKYKEFYDLYMSAKQQQIEVLIDEILEICDDTQNDYTIDSKGDKVVNRDHILRARLKIDTRKWLACKLVPRIYGDKVIQQHDVTVKQEDALKELG